MNDMRSDRDDERGPARRPPSRLAALSTWLTEPAATRARRLLEARIAQRSPADFRFDVVQLPRKSDARRVLGPHTLIDAAEIERLTDQQVDRVGAIPTDGMGPLSMILAHRVAARAAAKVGAATGLPPLLSTNAMEYPFWIELCMIVPLRHVARALARHPKGDPILVELDDDAFTFWMAFEHKKMAPLYLYAELYRLGCPVFLLRRARARRVKRLSFRIVHLWGVYEPKVEARLVDMPIAVVPSGIRKASACVPPGRVAYSIAGPHTRATFTHDLAEGLSPASDVVVDLECVHRLESAIHPGRKAALLSSRPLSPNLLSHVFEDCASRFKALVDNATRFVAEHQIREACICDHVFPQPSFMAHAVSAAGGRVTLYPHSSNPCYFRSPRGYGVDRIFCTTRSGATVWSKALPGAEVVVRGDLVLPALKPRASTRFADLSVVIIGGAHRLNLMPLYNRRKHARSLAGFVETLRSREPGIKICFKTNPGLQDEDYLRAVVPSAEVTCLTENPLTLGLPGLILVSITTGSTMIFEGIANNAVAMIVRDFPVYDYTLISDGAVPIRSAWQIVDMIGQCKVPAAYDRHLAAQREWLIRETNMTEP